MSGRIAGFDGIFGRLDISECAGGECDCVGITCGTSGLDIPEGNSTSLSLGGLIFSTGAWLSNK